MTIETLLQVLFANNREDLVALAVKIDNKIDTGELTEIKITVETEDLVPGSKLVDREGKDIKRGRVSCPIISTNIYKLTGQHVVQLPNGRLKMGVSGEENKYDSEARIVAVVETEEALNLDINKL